MPDKDAKTGNYCDKAGTKAAIEVFLSCHIRDRYFQLLRAYSKAAQDKGVTCLATGYQAHEGFALPAHDQAQDDILS